MIAETPRTVIVEGNYYWCGRSRTVAFWRGVRVEGTTKRVSGA
ncbi:hypothetical protein OHT76_41995 [Streptomyces sp. NBC_00287]|nr:hypothetical protein [Streptomyces sp. NBC_00287]